MKPSGTLQIGDKYTPNEQESLFGIVSDNSGNFYIVKSSIDRGSNAVILKYNAAGEFQGSSPVDPVNGSSIINGVLVNGWNKAIGITWSETTNRLYVSNFSTQVNEDCIAVFDANTMNYLGAGAANPPGAGAGDQGKAIGIIKECCPSPGYNSNVTLTNVQVGDTYYLGDLVGSSCNGVICGGSWNDPGVPGFTYNSCDNSITITSSNLCGTFVLNGSNAQCGNFDLTLNGLYPNQRLRRFA
jgi:hypothetical protein